MNQILEGMKILAKYDEDFMIAAEHDTIYAKLRNHISVMSDEDFSKMFDLDWMWDDDGDDGWSHFT